MAGLCENGNEPPGSLKANKCGVITIELNLKILLSHIKRTCDMSKHRKMKITMREVRPTPWIMSRCGSDGKSIQRAQLRGSGVPRERAYRAGFMKHEGRRDEGKGKGPRDEGKVHVQLLHAEKAPANSSSFSVIQSVSKPEQASQTCVPEFDSVCVRICVSIRRPEFECSGPQLEGPEFECSAVGGKFECSELSLKDPKNFPGEGGKEPSSPDDLVGKRTLCLLRGWPIDLAQLMINFNPRDLPRAF
ncbi:hypothetical protein ANN_26767 [Periplaneta americana]|uniref:Uncharacterized protein n=1 Tax=Periplaneta americana TaxID=6978 RepID=A0ABQ8RZ39_PERAM|nr:hypothetical protein ANN_26767 [Periplaneta americana]